MVTADEMGEDWDRAFLVPKPSRSERAEGGGHPTQKPLELMRHLVRLFVPEGGTVLDPFLGSGTTAVAATLESRDWLGCEREARYLATAAARVAAAEAQMAETAV